MDFARKQMEKYGWTEGKGLGKKEDGIRTAIKPKLKFDNAGIGHDMSKEFVDNWWERLYNNASNNIDVNVVKDKVEMKLKTSESIDITTKNYSSKKDLEFGSFIKTSKLTENGTISLKSKDPVETPADFIPKINLTDDELLAACGGRTAHKGARHGLNLNGKLSRLEKQEKVLLKIFKNFSLRDKGEIEKKLKKLDKHKNKSQCEGMKSSDGVDTLTVVSSKKKSKKNRRKKVSFNETVTEYHSQDLNTSGSQGLDNDSGNERPVELVVLTTKIKLDNNNEDNNNIEERLNSPPPDAGALDEGIEQDIEDEVDKGIDHKSFEEAQTTDFMSKEEKKLLKKKRHPKRKNTATARFLEEVLKTKENKFTCPDKHDSCGKCRKRKHKEQHANHAENSEQMETEDENANRKSAKRLQKKRMKLYFDHKEEMNCMVRTLNQKCKISDNE